MDSQKVGKFDKNEIAVFCCDMQEKFRPAISYFEDILFVSKRIVSRLIYHINIGPSGISSPY